jgi:hypothetical protein
VTAVTLTWQDVSNWLGLQQDDLDRKPIMRLAEAVELHVARRMGTYTFGENTRVDYAVDATGLEYIHLPDAPITAVTAIKIGRDSSNPVNTLDPTDPDVVVWYAYGKIERTDGGKFGTYKREKKYILVSYTAGWTADSLPEDVRLGLKLLVGYLWRSRGREAVKNELLSGMLNWTGRAMYEAPGVLDLLGQYMTPVIAGAPT